MARQDRYLEPFGNAINPLTGMPIFGDPVTAALGGIGDAVSSIGVGNALGIGSSLVGGVMGADASTSAADTQAASSDKATAQQQKMFDTINNQQAPYRGAGYTALSALMDGMGIGGQGGQDYQQAPQQRQQALSQDQWNAQNPATPPQNNQYVRNYGFDSHATNPAQQPSNPNGYTDYLNSFNASHQSQQSGQGYQGGGQGAPGVGYGGLTHQFNAKDLGTNLSPSYNFMLSQGLGALQNSAAAQGNLVGGNALKGINDYAQNYASNGYQQAYNNYNTNQSNIFDRLSHIAGMGQNANNTSATAGASISPQIASSIQNAGQANASGIVGANNNLTGGLSNAQSWYQYGKNPISGMSPMQEGVKSNIPGYGEVSTI